MKPNEAFERTEIYTRLRQTLTVVQGIISLALFHYTAYLLYSIYNFF